MTDKLLLSIDCGTQSLRAMIFNTDGDLLAIARKDYTPYQSPQPGWAEQDPEVYWESLVQTCRILKEQHPLLFEKIYGIGVTTQRASMINVDKQGKPLRNAILWLDQRRFKPGTLLPPWFKGALTLTPLAKKVMDIHAQGKCNWLRLNEPELWKTTHKYLQVSGFLNHRLTQVFADSTASQIGHLPFDYKKQAWAGPMKLPRILFPVEPDKLPRLINPGGVIGTVTAKAAEQTGLCEGLEVIACGSDKGCETLGAGVMDDTMISLSFGTTATVQTTCDRYFEPIPHMPPYPAPVPGCYNPEVEIFRGFWMITWFKNEFAHLEAQEARQRGISTEEVLNRCLERTSPGAMGLMVQPYWSPGLDLPHAKGAIIGFGDIHTRDHVYRAVIEGLGFALYEGMEKIKKKGRLSIKRAAVSGGASQSREICQIAADIFDIPMVKGKTHETSGLGAAMLTAAGVGLFSGIPRAVEQMSSQQTVFEPDPDHSRIYRSLYDKVYSNMYRALGPLYTHIQTITGYPST
ncbi:MAG: carbohydrate kinase [Desulfobacteraceae bacterium]|nr:MAG: carbohydrate kinase [Desulfobacteraceae bacterium]